MAAGQSHLGSPYTSPQDTESLSLGWKFHFTHVGLSDRVSPTGSKSTLGLCGEVALGKADSSHPEGSLIPLTSFLLPPLVAHTPDIDGFGTIK